MGSSKIYIGYAREDLALFNELSKHLTIGGAIVLHRRLVPPGEDESTFAAQLMTAADVFVPLISIEYLASEQGQREVSSGHKCIGPVSVRACSLKGTPLEGLQLLPQSKKAVASMRD
jgi:hypothetical protein